MNLKRNNAEESFARIQGRIIYNLRKNRELTRKQLAALTGVNEQLLYRVEMGDSTARAFDLVRIAEVLGVPLSTLFPPITREVAVSMFSAQGAMA